MDRLQEEKNKYKSLYENLEKEVNNL